jgi:hypothetical protein
VRVIVSDRQRDAPGLPFRLSVLDLQ